LSSSSSDEEETSVITEIAVPPVPPALLVQTAVSGTKTETVSYTKHHSQQFLVCDAQWFSVYLRCVYRGTGLKAASPTSFEPSCLLLCLALKCNKTANINEKVVHITGFDFCQQMLMAIFTQRKNSKNHKR